MKVNLEQAGKTKTLCQTGNRNMSTIVRRTASRRGEEYLEMSPGVGCGVDVTVILLCEICAEKCQSVRKRAWAFRSWFAGHIDPDSIERSWNSPAFADSHHLQLEDSHCIPIVRNWGSLRLDSRHCNLVAGVDSLYSGWSMNPRRTARLRVGAKGEY